MLVVRALLAGLGTLVSAYGGYLLLSRQDGDALVSAAVWLAAGVVLHDGVLAPLTLVITVVTARLLPEPWRRPATVALIVLAPLTLLAVPVLGGWGATPDDPGLLERPYLASWAVIVAATVLVVAVVGFWNRRGRQLERQEGRHGTRTRR